MDGTRAGLAVVFAFAGSTLFAPAAVAGAGFGFRGVGGKLMYVDAVDVEPTLGVGGIVCLGEVAPHLHLEGQVDYWRWTERSDSPRFGSRAESRVRDISLGGTIKYRAGPPNEAWQPVVRAGLALHFARSSVVSGLAGGSVSAADPETKLGFDLGAGVEYLSRRNRAVGVALKYRVVGELTQVEVGVSATKLVGQ